MPDSSLIDAEIANALLSDATLMAICPDGVFFDEASQGAQNFVLISLLDDRDEASFLGRAFEDALYLVKAVMLSTSGGDAKTAAARIDTVLEDRILTVAGYGAMTIYRETRLRITEVDAVDPAIRWQHRGGHYRLQIAVL